MSSLHHKMNRYEVIPPEDTWDRIVAALDESESGKSFPARLYQAEVDPPAAAWENISSSLHSPVVPLQNKRIPFLRYAAAAALIGFIAFGIIRWTSGSNDKVANPGIASSKKNNFPEKTNRSGTPAQATAVPRLDNQVANKKATASLRQTARHRPARNNPPVAASASYTYDAPPANDQYTNPLYAYEDYIPDLTDRYIMLMTPEGNIIRMAKKWSEMVCCVSGEEQDADCKSQLKKWQEKLAASPLAPSPGNFMDILNMVSSLDEMGTEL